jgi:hypothetical protein
MNQKPRTTVNKDKKKVCDLLKIKYCKFCGLTKCELERVPKLAGGFGIVFFKKSTFSFEDRGFYKREWIGSSSLDDEPSK